MNPPSPWSLGREVNGARGTRGVTRLGGTALVERFGRLDLSAYRRVIALAPRRRWPASLGRSPASASSRGPREQASAQTRQKSSVRSVHPRVNHPQELCLGRCRRDAAICRCSLWVFPEVVDTLFTVSVFRSVLHFLSVSLGWT